MEALPTTSVCQSLLCVFGATWHNLDPISCDIFFELCKNKTKCPLSLSEIECQLAPGWGLGILTSIIYSCELAVLLPLVQMDKLRLRTVLQLVSCSRIGIQTHILAHSSCP